VVGVLFGEVGWCVSLTVGGWEGRGGGGGGGGGKGPEYSNSQTHMRTAAS